MNTPITSTIVDHLGKKTIRTCVALGGYDRHELRIETSKMYGQAGVDTDATVVVVHADGNGFRHAFGLRDSLDGDFRRTVISQPGLRATATALLTQHATALVCLDGILAQARGHYVAREAAGLKRSDV